MRTPLRFRSVRAGRLLASLALPVALASRAPAIQVYDYYNLGSRDDALDTIWAGPSLNALIGADRFYAAGYTGARAVAANVGSGVASGLPEAMGALSADLTSTSVASMPTYHETTTSFLMAGRYAGRDDGAVYLTDDYSPPALANPSNYLYSPQNGHVYQDGIAPGSTLWTGGYAGLGANGGVVLTSTTFLSPFRTAMATGVDGRTADVINGSWGTNEANDSGTQRILSSGGTWLNAMAATHPTTTLVFAAGNRGEGDGKVTAPATNDNAISVGALALGGTGKYENPYASVASLSSGAPADYDGPDGHVAGVRAVVDLVAPGELMFTPAAATPDSLYPSDLPKNLYDLQGPATSWSTPIVSGGVALLKDVAHDRFAADPAALDSRVTKAVLMNAADKLEGWDNGQSLVNGVVRTSQALDYVQGAGRLNLGQAFDQFTAGTTDLPGLAGGRVQLVGWDFGSVADGGFNDYLLGNLQKGDSLTTTLAWFADVSDTGALDADGMPIVSQDAFTNLDLQVLRDGTLVAESDAAYITTQHLSFLLTETGDYTIRVLWAGDRYDFINKTTTPYALAWNVQATPEPGAFAALGLGVLALLRRRRPTLASR